MGISLLLCAALAWPQHPPAVPPLPGQLVLLDGGQHLPLPALGLGDGGVQASDPNGPSWTEDGILSPGGVQIVCRAVGVKLKWPSGRELLFSSDGRLHLRSGEHTDPMPFGAELWLGDGSRLQVRLQPGETPPLRSALLTHANTAAVIWRRGIAVRDTATANPFLGPHLGCLGDGGDVYRIVALGPLVVLDRLLVAEDRMATVPRQRLALFTAPLHEALQRLPRAHTGTEAPLRAAIDALRALAEHAHELLPLSTPLPRVDTAQLRWQIGGRCELGLDLDADRGPTLQWYAPEAGRPMVEWTLTERPTAYLTNPFDDRPTADRWYGNGVRLDAVASALQVRPGTPERGQALQALRDLRR